MAKIKNARELHELFSKIARFRPMRLLYQPYLVVFCPTLTSHQLINS